MLFSHKTEYALRAVLELAKRGKARPVKAGQISEAQGIPVRFLEVILNELKQGGFVESSRGREGGYLLSRSPATLSVGEVIGFVQGAVQAHCQAAKVECPFAGHCAFGSTWTRVDMAIGGVLNSTTFEGLLAEDGKAKAVQGYAI